MAATLHLLHTGFVDERGVGATVSLVLDGNARIVVDPGMVVDRQDILGPLRDHGLAPEDVTHVFLTHHHPDHTVNTALFPNAAVVDFWATYHGSTWTDHEGDGHRLSPHVSLILTPGHTDEDATLLVETDDGVVACTHLWWRADRTPEIDPLCDDQAALDASRARVLGLADIVVPGHGPPFRVAIGILTGVSVDRLEHSEQWRVRTFELDSNGHVNNAVYLNYAEQVAVDHAEALGFGREWAERHEVAWAVREHHVVYHRPAVYRDLLRLTTRVQSMSGVRATRYTAIRREADGELLAEVTTQWVCLKLPEQRPTRIPADLMGAYARDLKADDAGA